MTHIVHPVPRERKREVLSHIIRSRGLAQVLVFCGTRIGTNRLAHQLRRDHIQADAIHGDKTQGEREIALQDFKSGKIAVLVATDVASRGLDIEGLPQVINFDIPHSPEDYVHRIGRTGRAGLTGEAISLVSPEDHESLAAIEKLIKRKIEQVLVTGFEPNAGAVAGMMSRDEGRERRPRRERESPRIAPPREVRQPERQAERPVERQAQPRQERKVERRPERKPSDPIFSRPYEPASAEAAAPEMPDAPRSPRRERQVAALLGGLKKATA